jgi:hypothetical protein
MPLKEPPPFVRPLGRWSILVRKLEVVQDGTANVDVDVPLQFRSLIDVSTPRVRYWRTCSRAPGQGTLCIPVTEFPMESPLAVGTWTDVPITITVPPSAKPAQTRLSPLYASTIRTAGYSISCQMYDPDTGRRATFAFVITVLERARA